MHFLRRSSADERLELLMNVCNVNKWLESNDKQKLREISSVVGGDPTHEEAFKVQVKAWLKEFRLAISRVALSSGFRSSGLTAALTHTSFIGSTDGVSNGIIFDELTDFNDPTGVLSGAIEVIKEKVQALEAVSGASSKSALRARNFPKKSAIEYDLERNAITKTREMAKNEELTARVITGFVESANDGDFKDSSNQILDDGSSGFGRTTFIGPRAVFQVDNVSDTLLEVEGGLASFGYTGALNALKLATSRYVVIGARDTAGIGCVGGLDNMVHRSAGTMGVCKITEDTLVKLQGGPTKIGKTANGTNGISVNFMPGCTATDAFWGLKQGEIVMIPVSGLDDVASKVLGRMPDSYTVEDTIDSLASGTAVAGGTRQQTESTTDIASNLSSKRYIKLAEKVLSNVNFDTMIVFDMVHVLETDPSIKITGSATADNTSRVNKVSIASMSLSTDVVRESPRVELSAVVSSANITSNVKSIRRGWYDSELVRLIDGYDDYAKLNGESAVVTRAISELVSGAYQNDPSVLNSDFGPMIQLAVPGTDLAKEDEVFTALKNSAVTGVFLDPLDPAVWIGPDKGGSRMRVLTMDGKNRLFRKWARVMDYLAMLVITDIDYTEGQ